MAPPESTKKGLTAVLLFEPEGGSVGSRRPRFCRCVGLSVLLALSTACMKQLVDRALAAT